MTTTANGKGSTMLEPTRVCEASAYCERTDTGTAFHRFGVAYCEGHEHLLGFRVVGNDDPTPAYVPGRIVADNTWRRFEADAYWTDLRIADAAYHGTL